MDKLKDLCRLCQDPTQSIYDINQRALLSTVPYSKVISEMLNMEILHIDHWPTKICLFCITTIHNILTLRKTVKSAQKYFEETVQEAASLQEIRPLSKEISYHTTYDNVMVENSHSPLKRKAEDSPAKESVIPEQETSPQDSDINTSSEMVEILMMPEEDCEPPATTILTLPTSNGHEQNKSHDSTKGQERISAPPPKKVPRITLTTWGCKYCQQRFPSQSKLLWHKLEEHKDAMLRAKVIPAPEPKHTILCGKCGVLFVTVEEMQRHRKLIHDENLCPICKGYVKEFQDHVMREHTRSKQGCPVCQAKVLDVRRHLEIHMERYFKCPVCLCWFENDSLRLAHISDGCGGFSGATTAKV